MSSTWSRVEKQLQVKSANNVEGIVNPPQESRLR